MEGDPDFEVIATLTLPVYTPAGRPCGFTTTVIAARDEAAMPPLETGTEIQQVGAFAQTGVTV